jgi:hypothetical protein
MLQCLIECRKDRFWKKNCTSKLRYFQKLPYKYIIVAEIQKYIF